MYRIKNAAKNQITGCHKAPKLQFTQTSKLVLVITLRDPKRHICVLPQQIKQGLTTLRAKIKQASQAQVVERLQTYENRGTEYYRQTKISHMG